MNSVSEDFRDVQQLDAYFERRRLAELELQLNVSRKEYALGLAKSAAIACIGVGAGVFLCSLAWSIIKGVKEFPVLASNPSAIDEGALTTLAPPPMPAAPAPMVKPLKEFTDKTLFGVLERTDDHHLIMRDGHSLVPCVHDANEECVKDAKGDPVIDMDFRESPTHAQWIGREVYCAPVPGHPRQVYAWARDGDNLVELKTERVPPEEKADGESPGEKPEESRI